MVYFDNVILHRLQRRYRIGIGCRRRPIKIPDFQPIFNILLPKCFASGPLPRTPLGGFRRPGPPVEKRCRGPHRIAGPRAPRPHDPPLTSSLCIIGSPEDNSKHEISTKYTVTAINTYQYQKSDASSKRRQR